MIASIGSNGTQHINFESFGVRIRVTADTPEVIERIPAMLPPGASECPASTVQGSFGLLADGHRSYRFERDDSPAAGHLDLEFALMLLENQLRIYLASNARDGIFVHAGVVAHDGRAIVIPGASLAGKTTLVLELVRAGARYYSDEFAVLDSHGLVRPYRATPSPREPMAPDDLDLEPLDGAGAEEPLPIGVVVLTTYRPGAHWNPVRLSAGRGALAVLAHAPASRTRPEEAIRVVRKATDGALILEGERGEAREVVSKVLTDLQT